MSTAKELRAHDDATLSRELLELRRELFNLRMREGGGQVARHHRIGQARRDIARIKTVQRERAAAQNNEAQS